MAQPGRLGVFDATMIVMGGIVGSGIFMNPTVVAQRVPTARLILLAWVLGGALALAGAFVWAELAARRPEVGGQYAYLREASHPLVAFLYGWVLLLVIQSGGMAAVAMTFARYARELTGAPVAEGVLAALALGVLTLVNCVGVRAGSNVQSALMLAKIAAIVALVSCGLMVRPPAAASPVVGAPSLGLMAALVPVLFAYGGWQTASFVAGDMRDPRRDLPRGLLMGVVGVIVLYVAVNAVCVRALGPQALAATSAPASEVMRRALGENGARLIAAGIAISTLGFLSQSILTAPRVYFAMAKDGLFFDAVARVHPVSGVPVTAIVMQGVVATVIALSGSYERILDYVVAMDFAFFGLTAATLFVYRRRDPVRAPYAVPGHPVTTALFVATCAAVVTTTVARAPRDAGMGFVILLAGVPAYAWWRRAR